MEHRPPWWMIGGHLQTIGAAMLAHTGERASHGNEDRPSAVPWQRYRIELKDGDFFDLDVVSPNRPNTHLTVFHGLEGSSRSHYALALASAAMAMGWSVAVPHFRGCSGEPNRLPRAYHSGDSVDIDTMLRASMQHSTATRHVALGASLGGNALAVWAGEHGSMAGTVVSAMVALGSPLDLKAAGEAIHRGANRYIYTPMFLRTMKQKAHLKAQLFPGTFDASAAQRAQSIAAFDDAFTAPLHGFKGVLDYYEKASAKTRLHRVGIPCLLVNAKNDPFVPCRSVTAGVTVSEHVTVCQPTFGGHVGYSSAGLGHTWRGSLQPMAKELLAWLDRRG